MICDSAVWKRAGKQRQSLIPLFKKQIATGGLVTVTDKNIIRWGRKYWEEKIFDIVSYTYGIQSSKN